MKVSAKEYRDKQNQATGLIFQAILGSVIIGLQVADIVSDYPDSIDYLDVSIVTIWPIIVVYALLRWRKLERMIKTMRVSDN
ncbi:hypothetical protein [Ekhidna sp.]|uniref:hypothetical protein n=1 Tax=Ekhidna sp. TaxID=2608089 RepID=UPI003B59FF62